MPARTIETSSAPFDAGVALAPITLDIVDNALRNARFERDAELFRTAISPGIRERHDAVPMIANRDGEMAVGQFASFIWGFPNDYHGAIEEGDIFLTNDPYSVSCAISHPNDWLTLMPIFRGGRPVAWAAMFGLTIHVGGKAAGPLPTDAAQICEKGIEIPPIKIFREGEPRTDLLDLPAHNRRLPEWNRSDFRAIIAAPRWPSGGYLRFATASARTASSP